MLFSNKNMPLWPRVIGARPKPTLRKSLGVLRGYVGIGRKHHAHRRKTVRAPMGVIHHVVHHHKRAPVGGRRKYAHRGGKLTVGKVLHGVNNFLKKSKLISTIGAPLIKQYAPKQYKGIPVQQIASHLLGVAKKQGYGRRRHHVRRHVMGGIRHYKRHPVRHVMGGIRHYKRHPVRHHVMGGLRHHRRRHVMGGAHGRINTRKTLNTFRDIGKFLHKTKVLSKIAQPLSTLVPGEYKPYADAGLKILSNLGAGRRRRRHHVRRHVGDHL